MTLTIEQALREVSLFHHLPDNELAVLSRQVFVRQYGRNALIFAQGDAADGLYIIMQGHVSISRQNPEGDELIYGFYEPGEYFGELALFDNEPRAAGAVTMDECTLLFLSRGGFRAFLEVHPGVLFTCLTIVVKQLRRCTDLADEIALLDIRSRLARRLLRLATEGVLDTSGTGRHSSFRITQQQLANMMGATRESVNKHLNTLVDGAVLRLERGHITVLDRDRLERIAQGFD